MRLGQTLEVKIEDVTLSCQMDWGQFKQLQREVQALDNTDTGQLIAIAEQAVQDYVVHLEGLEDETGAPLTRITPEVVGRLPAQFMTKVIPALLSLGESLTVPPTTSGR